MTQQEKDQNENSPRIQIDISAKEMCTRRRRIVVAPFHQPLGKRESQWQLDGVSHRPGQPRGSRERTPAWPGTRRNGASCALLVGSRNDTAGWEEGGEGSRVWTTPQRPVRGCAWAGERWDRSSPGDACLRVRGGVIGDGPEVGTTQTVSGPAEEGTHQTGPLLTTENRSAIKTNERPDTPHPADGPRKKFC